jgi:hypothetical protein
VSTHTGNTEKIQPLLHDSTTPATYSKEVRAPILPSNLDIKVSASNLRDEVSGKYERNKHCKFYTPGKEPETSNKRRKVSFSHPLDTDQDQATSITSTHFLTWLNSDEVNENYEDIVQPQEEVVSLPLPPTTIRVDKPTSTQEEDSLLTAVQKLSCGSVGGQERGGVPSDQRIEH